MGLTKSRNCLYFSLRTWLIYLTIFYFILRMCRREFSDDRHLYRPAEIRLNAVYELYDLTWRKFCPLAGMGSFSLRMNKMYLLHHAKMINKILLVSSHNIKIQKEWFSFYSELTPGLMFCPFCRFRLVPRYLWHTQQDNQLYLLELAKPTLI